MSEASCPAKKSRKLGCCSARQRVVKRNSPLRVIALRAPSEGAPHSIAEVPPIHTHGSASQEHQIGPIERLHCKEGSTPADFPEEGRVVQPRVARRFRHILQHAQLLLDHPFSLRRHLLPFGHHFVTDMGALLGSHSRPHLFAVAHVHALLRRQTVPVLQVPPHPLLLLGRQAVESLIVLEEAFLLLRRHVAEPFHPARGQVVSVARANWTAAGKCGSGVAIPPRRI